MGNLSSRLGHIRDEAVSGHDEGEAKSQTFSIRAIRRSSKAGHTELFEAVVVSISESMSQSAKLHRDWNSLVHGVACREYLQKPFLVHVCHLVAIVIVVNLRCLMLGFGW